MKPPDMMGAKEKLLQAAQKMPRKKVEEETA